MNGPMQREEANSAPSLRAPTSGDQNKSIKLNLKMPNTGKTLSSLVVGLIFLAAAAEASLSAGYNNNNNNNNNHHHHHHQSLLHHGGQPELAHANEISHQQQLPSNYSHLSREVTNLRTTPELRSVRLRWNYAQPANVGQAGAVKPVAFEIRYCELTSWMAEIKCRYRNVPVVLSSANGDDSSQTSLPPNDNKSPHANHSTVITQNDQQPQQAARPHLELAARLVIDSNDLDGGKFVSPSSIELTHKGNSPGSTFESRIYDLRALTNYTFGVRVSRFAGEPLAVFHTLAAGSKLRPPSASQATRPARRLDLTGGGAHTANELIDWPASGEQLARAETKPFQAEALKCLANSSEVLINTGRYFGGRISIESQPFDQRCQVVGNRTSSQSSYLLRIDHELCRSKVIDSNRIETMILVHENKDILTHNTARFLVQCNIMQKSFTVKASVSLPKVNSLNQWNGNALAPPTNFQPATITVLSKRPGNSAASSLAPPSGSEQHVRLGNMPGVYRLVRTNADGHHDVGPPHGADALGDARAAASDMVPTRVRAPTDSSSGQHLSARRSKELLVSEPTPGHRDHHKSHTTTTTTTSGDNYQLDLPRPVEVSSKILFVSRALNTNPNEEHQTANQMQPLVAVEPPQHQNAQQQQVARQQSQITSQIVPADGHAEAASFQATTTGHSSHERQAQQSQVVGDERRARLSSGAGDEHRQRSAAVANTNGAQDDDNSPQTISSSMTAPIVITNNHRVVSDFLPLAQVATTTTTTTQHRGPEGTGPSRSAAATTDRETAASSGDYSIRYSTDTAIDEYSLGRLEGKAPLATRPSRVDRTSGDGEQSPATSRSRSGRMRHIEATSAQQFGSVDRLGEALLTSRDAAGGGGGQIELMPPVELIWAKSRGPTNETQAGARVGEAENIINNTNSSIATTVGPTLAQNITGAILRWSLKTLGNLARKSLESLIDERELNNNSNNNQSTEQFDGFEVQRSSALESRNGAPTIVIQERKNPPIIIVTTPASSSSGSNHRSGQQQQHQQHTKAATQSADMLLSKVPHHLEPPPTTWSGSPARSGELRQPTTTSLPRTTASLQALASAHPPTSNASTTRPTTIQRQQKSTGNNNSQPEHSQPQAASAHMRFRPPDTGGESRNSTSIKRAQADNGGTGGVSPMLLVAAWAAACLALLILIIYFVALSSRQIFKPANNAGASGQRYDEQRGLAQHCQQTKPRLGFLSQLNDAIHQDHHRQHHVAGEGPAKSANNANNANPVNGAPYGVHLVGAAPGSRDVRSPSLQRRSHEQLNQASDFGAMPSGRALRQPLGSPSASDEFSSGLTRSTSAASTSNISATTDSPTNNEQVQENYCKNHEQFVYSDYLLLNRSDCLSNDCGRESFA